MFVLHAFVINVNCISVCGYGCKRWEQKARGIRKEEMRYLRVMLDLYKILAHFLINSTLNDDHPVFCLVSQH